MYISCNGIIREDIFCREINIELDLSRGLFSFLIVGLADKCIGESKERIISAIKNSGYDSPKTKNHKIIVSLAPAGIKKEGVFLDLPIAVAYLAATKIIKIEKLNKSIFIGELGLDGSIKTNDFLASIIKNIEDKKYNTKNDHTFNTILGNFKEEDIKLTAGLIHKNVQIISVKNLKELVFILNNNTESFLKPVRKENGEILNKQNKNTEIDYEIDKVFGQEKAKRALLIAICSKCNLILFGPPGIGKTMLAKSAHQILPSPNKKDILDLLIINKNINRPFRSPHHTSSYTAIIGGGNPIISGEITLAHNGILFLDELPEFNKNILESLRQPLEEKSIQINRTGEFINFPCDTLCIGAMNLCPCGNRGIPNKNCVCGPGVRNKYLQKLSQPLLERFPIIIKLNYETTILNKKIINNNGGDTNTNTNININTHRLKGKEMHEIIETIYNIKSTNNHIFTWETRALEIFNKLSFFNNYSIRVKKHLETITETIALIENIKNFANKNTSQKQEQAKIINTEKVEILIKERFVLESFSYRENIN